MIVCVPVTEGGLVDPRWGRAHRVAVATVLEHRVNDWREIEVDWDRLHDEGSPAQHHARVARFLLEHHVQGVIAQHVGEGMVRMLRTMKIDLFLDAVGDARAAAARAPWGGEIANAQLSNFPLVVDSKLHWRR